MESPGGAGAEEEDEEAINLLEKTLLNVLQTFPELTLRFRFLYLLAQLNETIAIR